MNFLRKLAVVIIALGSVCVAQADPILVEGQCDGTANAAVTCDTSTGLEWLDLTATIGLSVNQFRANEGGWLSQGWGIATRKV
jgi:glutamate synthase domain-containing protein 2